MMKKDIVERNLLLYTEVLHIKAKYRKCSEVTGNMNGEEKRWQEYRRQVEIELETWLARQQQGTESQDEIRAHLMECERQLAELDRVLEQARHEAEEEQRKRRLQRWMAWAIWYDMERHHHKTRYHRRSTPELVNALHVADAPTRILDFAREFKEFLATIKAQEDSTVPLLTATQLCNALLCSELRTAEVFLTIARQAERLLAQPDAQAQCTDEQMRLLQGAVKIGKIFRKGLAGQDILQHVDGDENAYEKAKEDVIFSKYVEQILLGSNDVQKRAEILVGMNGSGGKRKLMDGAGLSRPTAKKQKIPAKTIEKNPMSL